MPHRPPAVSQLLVRCCLSFAVCGVLLAGTACQRDGAPQPNPIRVMVPAKATAATKPVDAVNILRDRLLARDGAGFARLAVPPALHAQLLEGWQQGRSRWPLDELPLDSKLPKMLAALQEKDAQSKLMATFRRQFAGADRDIDQAIRTLVQFGGEYVHKEADYTGQEREHVGQALVALGRWAVAAPLSDPKRAQPFFAALAGAAQRSGIDGASGNAAFAKLGMETSLARLSPFIATLLAQLRTQYGLDIDATLRGMEVRLQDQTGDTARLRLRYTLAGSDIDAIVPVTRIDGHWYLADFLQRAQASVAGATPPAGGGNTTSP